MPCSVGIYTNVYVYACIFMCASCWSLFVSLYLSNILRNCNRNTLCIAWRTTKMCVLFAFKMATGFLLVSSIFLFRSFTCTSRVFFFYFASNELASIFNVKVFHFDSVFLTITFFFGNAIVCIGNNYFWCFSKTLKFFQPKKKELVWFSMCHPI